MRQLLLLLLALVPFLSSGCLYTLRPEGSGGLQDDIKNLRGEISGMTQNQAGLSSQIDSLNTSMTSLNEKLEESKQRMSSLAQKMDDIQANLVQRLDIVNKKMSPEIPTDDITPPPSDLYKLAFADYSRNKYDLAINGFRAFMDQYPESELAGTAQFYLSDCYFNKKDYKTAVEEYDRLASKYPHNDNMPVAKFRKALALIELNQLKDAKRILEYIVLTYPKSQEANLAKEKLKSFVK